MRIPIMKLYDDNDSFIDISDIRYAYKASYDEVPALHVKFKGEESEIGFLYTDNEDILYDDMKKIEELLFHFNKVYINAEGMPFAPGGVNEQIQE